MHPVCLLALSTFMERSEVSCNPTRVTCVVTCIHRVTQIYIYGVRLSPYTTVVRSCPLMTSRMCVSRLRRAGDGRPASKAQSEKARAKPSGLKAPAAAYVRTMVVRLGRTTCLPRVLGCGLCLRAACLRRRPSEAPHTHTDGTHKFRADGCRPRTSPKVQTLLRP